MGCARSSASASPTRNLPGRLWWNSMAEGLPNKKTRARETHRAFSRDKFESTPEFANFKRGMKALLAVPKAELDELIRKAKEASPRAGNPHSAGRKKRADTR